MYNYGYFFIIAISLATFFLITIVLDKTAPGSLLENMSLMSYRRGGYDDDEEEEEDTDDDEEEDTDDDEEEDTDDDE